MVVIFKDALCLLKILSENFMIFENLCCFNWKCLIWISI